MQKISVLLPSRGRPGLLLRALQSLETHENVEILVGLDDDDARLHDYRTNAIAMDQPVTYLVGARGNGVATVFNRLASAATGDLLWCFSDDYVISGGKTVWPTALRAAASTLAGGVGIFAPHDLREPDLFNMYGMTRKTYEIAGAFVEELYPFWFGDRTWDEVGQMADARARADFSVITPDGHGDTSCMRDLAFWVRVFEAQRLKRAQLALRLMVAKLGARAAEAAARNAYLSSPEFLATWESNGREQMGDRYETMKATAEALLDRQAAAVPQSLHAK